MGGDRKATNFWSPSHLRGLPFAGPGGSLLFGQAPEAPVLPAGSWPASELQGCPDQGPQAGDWHTDVFEIRCQQGCLLLGPKMTASPGLPMASPRAPVSSFPFLIRTPAPLAQGPR